TACWTVAQAAGGIPRRINILADNVLIAGFGSNQRPVGSQLAAATVREFAANSGATHPTRSRRFSWRRRLMRPHDEMPADVVTAPAAEAVPWEIAPLEPVGEIEPESPPEPEAQAEPELVSNIVRPQFLGSRVDAPPVHAALRSIWHIRVRPQERFRLRPRGDLVGVARRSGASS